MSDYRSAGLDAFVPVLDGNEGWRGPPNLPGDFYPQSDLTSLQGDYYRESDVVRGVTMDIPAVNFLGIEGDFYGCEDDVCRGTTMDFAAVDPFSLGPFGFHDLAGKGSDCLDKVDFPPLENQVPHLVAHLGRFMKAHCPPPRPSDTLFSYETTTLLVSDVEPSEIGNHLLDFMGSKVPACITKVCPKKFAIKADVFDDLVMCSLKIRIYQEQQPRKYAVEFQRRSGDCVSFNNVFQLAAQSLKQRFPTVENAPEAAEVLSPRQSGLAMNSICEADLSPLLDLAGQRHPSLQAESAAALADLAQDVENVEHLCSDRAFGEIAKLLESSQTDVAYPTARLLASLARCKKAEAYFACHGLLPTILDKVQKERQWSLVQHELAQVLNAGISLCASTLTPDVSQQLASSLADALQAFGTDRGPLSKNLEEAHRVLQFQLAGGSRWS